MQSSIARLATVPAEDQAPLILNPFSQFVIIHAILRFLFEDCIYVISESSSTNPSGSGSGSAASTSTSASTSSRSGSMSKDNEDDYSTKINLVIQYMLHNWLQTYFHSPESRRPSSENTIPVFVHDALPFYWIAQVSLLAYQEGLPPFASETQSLNASGEAKYCLMKEWFKHIREFLKRGEQGPTLFWDELMKIRMQSLREGDNVVEGPDGILDFFQDEKKDGYR